MPDDARKLIDVVMDIPRDTITVDRQSQITLKKRIERVDVVERKLLEARRALKDGLAALADVSTDVPVSVHDALVAALNALPERIE